MKEDTKSLAEDLGRYVVGVVYGVIFLLLTRLALFKLYAVILSQ